MLLARLAFRSTRPAIDGAVSIGRHSLNTSCRAGSLQMHRDLLRIKMRRRSSAAKRSEEHTSELQSRLHLVCRLLLEKKNNALHSRIPPPATPLIKPNCATHIHELVAT